MTSWICGVCGDRVYGFEGERGHVVGRCKHCGQPYGLSTGVDKELRVKWRLSKEVAKMDFEAFATDDYGPDHEATWHISKMIPAKDGVEFKHYHTRVAGKFSEALERASLVSKGMEEGHVIVEIGHRTVAIYINGERQPLYYAIARFKTTQNPVQGQPFKVVNNCVIVEYTKDRAMQRAAKNIGTLSNIEDLTIYGPYDAETFYNTQRDHYKATREKRIRELEDRIRMQEGCA